MELVKCLGSMYGYFASYLCNLSNVYLMSMDFTCLFNLYGWSTIAFHLFNVMVLNIGISFHFLSVEWKDTD